MKSKLETGAQKYEVGAKTHQVRLKGEKGQYNETLRPSEREDACLTGEEPDVVAPVQSVNQARSQTSSQMPPKNEQ